MSDIIEKTYNLLDSLDSSDLIKKMTIAKNNLLKNKQVLAKISSYQKESNYQKKIEIKKELFKNKDYINYLNCYQQLSLIILKINYQYKKYTDTKGFNC